MTIDKVVTVSLTEELRQSLANEAKVQKRSRSWIVREALTEYVAKRRDAQFAEARDHLFLDALKQTPAERVKEAESIWNEATSQRGPAARLVRVCALLNAHQVRYVIVGAQAGQLHGFVRATRDVDVLIDATLENATRALEALSELPFKVAADMTAEYVLERTVTTIGDTPNVDLLTRAWNVRYEDAVRTAHADIVDGVPVVYADIDTLIQSKQTGRLQDRADIEALERIKELSK